LEKWPLEKPPKEGNEQETGEVDKAKERDGKKKARKPDESPEMTFLRNVSPGNCMKAFTHRK
jgi:hypothetical protein